MDVSKFTHELLDVIQSPKVYNTTIQIPINTKENGNDVLCTLSFDVSYTPSYKDIREELCNVIGKIATQKSIAREELRKAAIQVHELSMNTTSGGDSTKPSTKPAITSGFLNKDPTSKDETTTQQPQQPPKWYQLWYEQMNISLTIIPILKNYIFFISFTIVSHYYGHHLAIPPPV
jgi:hypothetical protein